MQDDTRKQNSKICLGKKKAPQFNILEYPINGSRYGRPYGPVVKTSKLEFKLKENL